MESEFLKHLREEKLKTQDIRANYVVRKLVFATTLLGIGTLKIESFSFNFLLYLVPYVTLSFDLYYLAEDYSVKRIGAFLCMVSSSNLEKEWEKWVSLNRDPFAPLAMPFLTTLISLGSVLGLWYSNANLNWYFFIWFFTAIILCWGLFFYNKYLRYHLNKTIDSYEK